MEEIASLLKKYHLEEDHEHIIMPVERPDGRRERIFLLKRRYIRIVHSEGHFDDYPIEEIVEALVTYPEMALRASILLVHREPEDGMEKEHAAENAGEGDSLHEEKDSDQREVP